MIEHFFRWFLETSELYSAYIMIQLIASMIILSAVMFQLDLVNPVSVHKIQFSWKNFVWTIHFCKKYFQELKHLDFNVAIIFLAVIVGATNLFVFCFYGKLATDSYEKMTKCVFESNWQELPVDLQKYLILMIGNAQRPLYYHGFRIAVLNLETFCTVTQI